MAQPSPAEKFLQQHTSSKDFTSLQNMVGSTPIKALRAALKKQHLDFPKEYWFLSQKIAELKGANDPEVVYTIKLGYKRLSLTARELGPKLRAKKRLYAREAFFKKHLMDDIDRLFVRLNLDAGVLAEYKGADETWIWEASSAIRSKNTDLRRELKELIQLLTFCCEKHIGEGTRSNKL